MVARRGFFLLMLLFIGCTSVVSEPDAGFNTFAGSRISWKRNFPVVLFIDASLPGEFHDAAYAAAQDWNDSVHQSLIVVIDDVELSARKENPLSNGIYFLQNWAVTKQSKNVQSFCRLVYTGDVIEQANVYVNGQDYAFANGKAARKLDMESLLVHEFGHALGLKHSKKKDSVMQESLPVDMIRRMPSQEDSRNLSAEYF